MYYNLHEKRYALSKASSCRLIKARSLWTGFARFLIDTSQKVLLFCLRCPETLGRLIIRLQLSRGKYTPSITPPFEIIPTNNLATCSVRFLCSFGGKKSGYKYKNTLIPGKRSQLNTNPLCNYNYRNVMCLLYLLTVGW